MKYLALSVILLFTGSSGFSQTGQFERLEGRIVTYHSMGAGEYAVQLQELIEDAAGYFETIFGDSIQVELFVLNRKDARLLHVGYPMPSSDDDPPRIFMPARGYFGLKLKKGEEILGMNEWHASDFIAVHELGHIICHRDSIRTHKWFGEFIADYFMMGYLTDRLPERAYPAWTGNLFKCLPLRYISLEKFEFRHGRMGGLNYVAYQIKFNELAFDLYKEKGWDFIEEMSQFYDSLKTSGLDRMTAFPVVTDKISSLSPEADEWVESMRPTWQPYLIFMVLLTAGTFTFIFYRKKRSKRPMTRIL